ncbi:MAG: LytTR family DNA-binding domain-containing protein [Saprospiraceae bacterium]|nr:LytTR family DNA-binding domain-containing protein [Saprospiraceae bacterium]
MTCATSPYQRLLVPTFQTLELVEVKDIISIKAFENYSRIFLTQNRMYTSTQAFGKFVAMLEHHNFYQCHKSYVVNLDQIVRYHKNGEIEMTGEIKIPVARRRKEEFLEKLTQQIALAVH